MAATQRDHGPVTTPALLGPPPAGLALRPPAGRWPAAIESPLLRVVSHHPGLAYIARDGQPRFFSDGW